MNTVRFLEAFEAIRLANLGKQLDRRELSILASRHGIYFDNAMWVCGLSTLFYANKIGKKYVYSFKNKETSLDVINDMAVKLHVYRANTLRKINAAKATLRRYGVTTL
jgi:hypothetical protein